MARSSDLLIFELGVEDELTLSDFDAVTRRRDVYDLDEGDLATPGSLADAAERIQPLQWHFSSLAGARHDQLEELLAATPPEARRVRRRLEAQLEACPIELCDDGEVKEWLLALPKRAFGAVRRETRAWLKEEPYLQMEEDYFDLPGDGGRAAWEILRGQPADVIEELGLEFVEGDDRGTDRVYLRRSPAAASRRARALGLPYRFR